MSEPIVLEEDITTHRRASNCASQKGNSAYTAYTVDEADVSKGCSKDSVTIDTNLSTAFALIGESISYGCV